MGKINIVSKEYFYKNIKGEFNKYFLDKIPTFFNSLTFSSNLYNASLLPNRIIYFMTSDNKFFIYINSFRVLLIPKEYNNEEVLKGIEESTCISLSNFKIKYISKEVPYIKGIYYHYKILSDLIVKESSLFPRIKTGTYKLINSLENKEDEFSLVNIKDSTFYNIYIGIPSMKTLIGIELTGKMKHFIELIKIILDKTY